MPEHRIESLSALRALIPPPPAIMHKRLQRSLDEICLLMIRKATVCAVGFSDPRLDIEYLDLRHHPVLRAVGQDIHLPWPADKEIPDQPIEELACSLYFILPGVGFSLRANGRGSLRNGKLLQFRAEALFLHCSRAKVRADFWRVREHASPLSPSTGQVLSETAQAFIAASPYLLMLTQRQAEATEMSPRGDPAGFVQVLDRHTLLVPERPGNKVACSLSNILVDGSLRLSFLQPGIDTVLSVAGRAWLTNDPSLLALLAINNKPPRIATIVNVERYRFQHCPELLAAGLWDRATHLDEGQIPAFSKMLSEHMNGKGLLGKATGLVVDAVVKHDLRHLY